MNDRRINPRMLCADLVDVRWKDKNNVRHETVANLEDISATGACLQIEVEIPLQSEILLHMGGSSLQGRVKYCVFRDIGYFIGVEFDETSKWTRGKFRPQHLLDPRRLLKTKNSGRDMRAAS
jgi:hypothetical protein